MKYFNSLLKLASALLLVMLIGCQSAPDTEMIRSEIVAIHNDLIDAHFDKNIDYFIRDLSSDFISVSNGEILSPTVGEIKSQFENYLNNTTFAEYRYLREPIIGFSKDGSVAWSIVQAKVMGEQRMDDGTVRKLDFICAWMTLYKRHDKKWIKLAEASNFK